MAESLYDKFEIATLLGLVPGYIADTKFGRNASIGTVQETIWDGGGLYTYLGHGVSDTLNVTSGSILDVNLVIRITGQDVSNVEFSEMVTLDATNPTTTPVVTIGKFHRVYKAEVISPRINAGLISIISNAVGTPALAFISIGEGRTQMALYTVPRGKTLIIKDAIATIQGSKIGTVRARTRSPLMSGFVTQRVYDISAGVPPRTPINAVIPERHDYELTAVTALSTAGFSVNLFTILIDNDVLIGR